jgi:phosphoribosylanthranilate isomerase
VKVAEKREDFMEIKICGLTRPKEAEYINEAAADYAGFVLFEKSKRYVTIEQAKLIMQGLNPGIRKVAVTVSPDVALAKDAEAAGFDILQVHKNLSSEVLQKISIPVWYAFNIADEDELEKQQEFFRKLPEELSRKITAIVVDGAEYGSGKPFNWRKSKRLKKAGAQSPPDIFTNRKFVLAGGLTAENVAEGIRTFEPDIVDVSSGVEETERIPGTGKLPEHRTTGKSRERILAFAEKVRNVT